MQSSYSIFKRIANLVLVVIGIIICINLWLMNNQQAENWHQQQSNQLGRSMSLLASKVLTLPLQNNDSQAITQQLEFIAADPHVLGVALYNIKGQLIDEQKNALSVLVNHQQQQEAPLVFVEEIRFEDQILGYFRLMLSEQNVMQFHAQYLQKFSQQLLVLMLLGVAAGLLLTRAWYKFRFRKEIEAKKTDK